MTNSRANHIVIDWQVKNVSVKYSSKIRHWQRSCNTIFPTNKMKRSNKKEKRNSQLSPNKSKIKYIFKWIFNARMTNTRCLESFLLFVLLSSFLSMCWIFLDSTRMRHSKSQWIFFRTFSMPFSSRFGCACVCVCLNVLCDHERTEIVMATNWTFWGSSQCSTHSVCDRTSSTPFHTWFFSLFFR